MEDLNMKQARSGGQILFLGLVFIIWAWNTTGHSADLSSLLKQGLKTIDVQPASRQLLVVTNGPYLHQQDVSGLVHVRAIEQTVGATVGAGNLLFFWRDKSYPLLVMLFNKQDGKSVVIKQKGDVFHSETLDLSWEKVNQPQFWVEAVNYETGRDLKAMVPLAHAWANGVPYEYLKLAELHGDLCPGVTAGYLMVKFLEKEFPLEYGERYIIVATPSYCKDDAFQLLLGSTSGKKRLVASQLSEEQKKNITIPDPAGIVIVWKPSTQTGKGLALSFNFDEVRELVPTGKDSPKPIVTMSLFKRFNEPEQFVKAAARFAVDNMLYKKILETGVNPYELVGLTKK
jgi:formylmethanofuran dehydrogenase subunit E-like metal-binding protein